MTKTFFLIIFIVLLNVLWLGTLQAQDEKPCQEMENAKAKKFYQLGITKTKTTKEERLANLLKALDEEPDYVDANFAYAEERIKTMIYADAPFKPTEPYFRKVIQICPNYHSDPYYYLGFIFYEEESWDSATKYLSFFIKFKSDDDSKFHKEYPGMLSQAKDMYKYAKAYSELMNHPVPFEPHNVEGICTERDEYLPIITPDDEKMLFTRKVPYVDKFAAGGMQYDSQIEVFSASSRNPKTGKFDFGKPMPFPFNKGGNEGGASMSIDNKHLYFTTCKDEGGPVPNCDIYFSDFVDDNWTKPEKVENINDKLYWDSQPSIASDGTTLYFASDRKGGYGGTDLYLSRKDPITGKWGTPENLGRTINTNGDEKSPFIHSDFQTLYFCSNGLPGVGGFDIFLARKNEKGAWQEPKNIGVPINTKEDDLGFFVSTDGHFGYFSSNQSSRANAKSIGGYDVFYFELYAEARPDEVAFIKGKVEDKGNAPDKKFEVEIKDAETKKVTKAMVDTATGEFAVVVNTKVKHDLLVMVKKENYAFSSALVLKDSIKNTKPMKLNVVADTIKQGQTYTLNNIYYATNSATLDPRSMIVMEEFVAFLVSHPTVKIEIHGHTDNVGTEKGNLALSTDRAFTMRDILLAHQIDESRLIAFKGFGATQPIADNSTEAGRQKNRRTEFVIVEK